MSLFLRLIGNDAPAVSKAVDVLASMAATRRQIARKGFGLLVVAALIANFYGLALIGGGQ